MIMVCYFIMADPGTLRLFQTLERAESESWEQQIFTSESQAGLTDCVWQLALDRFRGQSSINCFWYKSTPCLSHAGFDLIRSSVNSYWRFLGKKLDEVLPRKNILYLFLVKNELQFLSGLIWYKSVLTIFMWCL